MEDEDEIGALGALSAGSMNVSGNYMQEFQRREAEREAQLADIYRSVAENIRARRGPSAAERWFSIAQAALTPTDSNWQTLGNVLGAVGGLSRADREETERREDAMRQLQIDRLKQAREADALMMKYAAAANKPQWINSRNPDGTLTLVPIYPGMAPGQMPGQPSGSAPSALPKTLPADFFGD